MRIAVNTRFLLKDKLEGIGWFSYETLKRITREHPEHDFIFFFDRPYKKEFVFSDNVTPVVVYPPARHPVLWYLWFELSVPLALKKYEADIFLSLDGFMSLKTAVPTLLVIHDIAFEHFEDHVTRATRMFYRHFTPKYAEAARRIATVSEYSKEDIVDQYGIEAGKIDVVYNGVNENYRPLNQQEKEQTRDQYSSGRPYFVFAGALQPRKNVANLFRAFDLFKEGTRSEIKLVIVGRKAWHYKPIMEAYGNMKHKNDVIFLGHLLAETLSRVIGASLGLVYVSLFEGFGIPIAEAHDAHVPVITSNVSSMPEVAGEGALLVNPGSVEEIADAMTAVFEDEGLRAKLVQKGAERAKSFSWKKTSDKLWASIERMIEELG